MKRPGVPACFAWKLIHTASANGYTTTLPRTSSVGRRNRAARKVWLFFSRSHHDGVMEQPRRRE
jgi:hypothetical protein